MSGKLGIIAGKGMLPESLIRHCIAEGREYFILAIEGETPPELLQNHPHGWVRLAAVGAAIKMLHKNNVTELTLAGRINRPSFSSLMPDMKGAKLLVRIASRRIGGDDAVLSALVEFLENEGFKVTGAQDILQNLLAEKGIWGSHAPTEADMVCIEQGLTIARGIGKLDIGQALVIQDNYVLGVEAAEGTDGLIKRINPYIKPDAPPAILIKVSKPGQETRADLPAIGIDTIINCHVSGIKGIAAEAGGCIVLDRPTLIARADECGIFLIGL